MAYEDVKDKVLGIVSELSDEMNYQALINKSSELIEYLNKNPSDKDYAYLIINVCANDVDDVRLKLFFYSILLQMPICLAKDNFALEQSVDILLKTPDISVEEKYVYFYEISYRLFVTPVLQTDDNKLLLWKLYNSIVKKYHDAIWSKEKFPYISIDKRNNDFYIVITDQILGEEHGPTKSALDRCRALIANNNNVLLINTGEMCFYDISVLFYGFVFANHVDELDNMESINYKGVSIPFCQIGKGIMDIPKLRDYLHIIYDYAPNMVIDIGGNTLLGNLCNYFIPTLAVTLGPDNLVRTTEKWQTLGRKITDKDRTMLQRIGYPEDKVIEMIMTFECKEQSIVLSKADLGMKEEDFEIAIVGGRLDDEVGPEFLEMIRKVAGSVSNVRFNFCGIFSKYEKLIGEDPVCSGICRFLGMQSDMMAVLDNIDLYVNPIRLGGGTSAQEAMLKGVPVVTCKTGDVYANCHDDFAVDDYDEMVQVIERYVNDADYYKSQSKKAHELGELEHDTIGEFNRIIEECHKRDDDNYFLNI
ncbi:glycosyltransferase [Butyrivibrio fibrisolvens]|uniref:glycosyltransferase n=1 Tax=Butyrivibrio fibrisolvens TaxID=831 RepID=UPI00040A1DEC|nr:glycosyltransferase [Butyrivibrio fibrisolvens]